MRFMQERESRSRSSSSPSSMRLLTDKTMKYELTMNAKPKIGKPDMAAWLAKHGDWEERVTHLDELVDIAFEAGRQSVMDEICAAEGHAYDEVAEDVLKCGVCGTTEAKVKVEAK